jgi:hypothetical protein
LVDWILATAALASLIAFLGIIVVFVPDIDLIIVTVFVGLLVFWDFWSTLRIKDGKDQV